MTTVHSNTLHKSSLLFLNVDTNPECIDMAVVLLHDVHKKYIRKRKMLHKRKQRSYKVRRSICVENAGTVMIKLKNNSRVSSVPRN